MNVSNMKSGALTFVDLFSGCGGLSLGLSKAGLQGVLAVERNADAFSTFEANFLPGAHPFKWPAGIKQQAWDIVELLRHDKLLAAMRNTVDLVSGGPPCQGFSFAGARYHLDPRNQLFKSYVKFVEIVSPRFVLIENVKGIMTEHGKVGRRRDAREGGRRPYSALIVDALTELGYDVAPPQIVHCSEFGVPQRRPRVIFFGVRHGTSTLDAGRFFELLLKDRTDFLKQLGLGARRPVTVKQAIGDLCRCHGEQPSSDGRPGFVYGCYGKSQHPFQELLRDSSRAGSLPTSHRFANHREATVTRFKKIMSKCRRGVQLSESDRRQFEISKHVVVPLEGDQVGHTLTTLPDDLIHFSEPRVLTVREYARMQTFPDSFRFKGPYTTGGKRRVTACPQYTQIGNAVPPFLGEALGRALRNFSDESRRADLNVRGR